MAFAFLGSVALVFSWLCALPLSGVASAGLSPAFSACSASALVAACGRSSFPALGSCSAFVFPAHVSCGGGKIRQFGF